MPTFRNSPRSPSFSTRTAVRLLILSCMSLAPSWSEAQSSTPLQPRIVNGSPVSNYRSPIVEVIGKDAEGTFICTGSVIASNAVLTAKHCAVAASHMTVKISGHTFRVTRVRKDPHAYSNAAGYVFNDVAILTLAKRTIKKPLALLVSAPPQPGDSVTILGYGLDEFGGLGTLRQGTAIISAVTADFVTTTFSSLRQSNSCNGDSGGPALLTYTDSHGLQHSGIVGTVSTGSAGGCSLGTDTNYINIQSPAVINFIVKAVPSVTLD